MTLFYNYVRLQKTWKWLPNMVGSDSIKLAFWITMHPNPLGLLCSSLAQNISQIWCRHYLYCPDWDHAFCPFSKSKTQARFPIGRLTDQSDSASFRPIKSEVEIENHPKNFMWVDSYSSPNRNSGNRKLQFLQFTYDGAMSCMFWWSAFWLADGLIKDEN